jgi:hypothetical protein
MKTFGKFTKIAVAAAVTGALVLPASAAFAGDRNNKTERAILGAVIGGIAGAALSDGDRGGIAIGAVAGAALGASTGHGDRYDRDHRYSSGYRDSRYGSGYGSSYNSGYGRSGYDNGYGRSGYDSRDHRGDRYNTGYRYDGRDGGGQYGNGYYGQRR